MKKILFSGIVLVCVVASASAQTTILDFEAPGTSTVFQYFGSSLDGTFNQVIANPNATGINTSSMVAQYVKPAVAEVWAGAFSNPNPATAVNLIANGKVAVKVHMDHIGSVTLKLESSTDGGDNWAVTVPNTKINEWEELVFDASLPSIDPPNTAASGHTYTRVVLFFDFGTAGTGADVTSYFDDIVALPAASVTTTILDFETPATGTLFQYFGSTLDGTFTQIIANPNPTGIDTSSMVSQFVKPAVAEVWAGAFSNPDPITPVDLSNGGQVCVKVHMDHIGNLALKLEGSLSGKPNWIQTVSNTKVGEWEELCFDASLPSLETPFETASGAYARLVLFFDFGTAGTGSDVTSYFDDIVVKSSGAPQIRTINFMVDMNNYSPNFDTVYVSGTFNNWSGNSNPLTDPDFDGIWEGSIMVPNGSYEYKVTLDNWAAQEQFIGTEECTKKDPSGQFVNRLLLVSADTELPKFCYNSCYACGEEIKITFKLGMGGVVPNPDGVWLAGGGNFDVPGGKYKMADDDLDGIYDLVVPRKKGFSSFYTFANGPCPDYSCKENLTDLPCGDPANFNDRFLPEVQSDMEVATCFGTCFTNAECVSGTNTPIEDAEVFNLLGNPPAAGYSLLEFGSEVQADKSVTLTNSIGQQVRQWNLNSSDATFRLQTTDLQSGIYFVTVRAGDRFYTRRLVN
jgi:hypothetical protein